LGAWNITLQSSAAKMEIAQRVAANAAGRTLISGCCVQGKQVIVASRSCAYNEAERACVINAKILIIQEYAMTKKAQRAKAPTPVSDSVVDAMEARLEHAQDHATAPDAPASPAPHTPESDSAEASHTPQANTHS
jgi:hypothetical protein